MERYFKDNSYIICYNKEGLFTTSKIKRWDTIRKLTKKILNTDVSMDDGKNSEKYRGKDSKDFSSRVQLLPRKDVMLYGTIPALEQRVYSKCTNCTRVFNPRDIMAHQSCPKHEPANLELYKKKFKSKSWHTPTKKPSSSGSVHSDNNSSHHHSSTNNNNNNNSSIASLKGSNEFEFKRPFTPPLNKHQTTNNNNKPVIIKKSSGSAGTTGKSIPELQITITDLELTKPSKIVSSTNKVSSPTKSPTSSSSSTTSSTSSSGKSSDSNKVSSSKSSSSSSSSSHHSSKSSGHHSSTTPSSRSPSSKSSSSSSSSGHHSSSSRSSSSHHSSSTKSRTSSHSSDQKKDINEHSSRGGTEQSRHSGSRSSEHERTRSSSRSSSSTETSHSSSSSSSHHHSSSSDKKLTSSSPKRRSSSSSSSSSSSNSHSNSSPRSSNSSSSSISTKSSPKHYNPDSHCGVVDGNKGHCMRSITCSNHRLELRKQVFGRSKDVHQLIAERKASKENDSSSSSSSSSKQHLTAAPSLYRLLNGKEVQNHVAEETTTTTTATTTTTTTSTTTEWKEVKSPVKNSSSAAAVVAEKIQNTTSSSSSSTSVPISKIPNLPSINSFVRVARVIPQPRVELISTILAKEPEENLVSTKTTNGYTNGKYLESSPDKVVHSVPFRILPVRAVSLRNSIRFVKIGNNLISVECPTTGSSKLQNKSISIPIANQDLTTVKHYAAHPKPFAVPTFNSRKMGGAILLGSNPLLEDQRDDLLTTIDFELETANKLETAIIDRELSDLNHHQNSLLKGKTEIKVSFKRSASDKLITNDSKKRITDTNGFTTLQTDDNETDESCISTDDDLELTRHEAIIRLIDRYGF